jgi:hypothetical protein
LDAISSPPLGFDYGPNLPPEMDAKHGTNRGCPVSRSPRLNVTAACRSKSSPNSKARPIRAVIVGSTGRESSSTAARWREHGRFWNRFRFQRPTVRGSCMVTRRSCSDFERSCFNSGNIPLSSPIENIANRGVQNARRFARKQRCIAANRAGSTQRTASDQGPRKANELR